MLRGLTLSWALLALPLMPAIAHANTQAYETWLGGFFNGPISGRWFFQGDVHYRAYADFSSHWVLVRPGLGYQVSPGMYLTLGYAWTPSWPHPDETFSERIDEHRAWEQWQYEWAPGQGPWKWQLRSRLEQRFRPRVNDDWGLRFRQMARVSYALDERWLLATWDELFLGLNKAAWGQAPGFDQNRYFLGLGYVVQPSRLRLELGYFNQFFPGAQHVNHAVMLNTFVGWK